MKEILKQIADILNDRPHEDGNPLWDVLSALRGPDEIATAILIKRATTAIIRAKIGLAANNASGAIVNKDSEKLLSVRKNIDNSEVSPHFVGHAQRAFSALGLHWYNVNKFEVTDGD